ncbi:hypothetical protein E2C01_100228 [Portunus trituberculatus]|uniref:Uncharacterized protein n=1 Tax=Portunus trituberculatus TaxID=210409 RepID=A0A5B7KCS9_PORTR|nr:hypothetical protein [Portunus trituberculatus]
MNTEPRCWNSILAWRRPAEAMSPAVKTTTRPATTCRTHHTKSAHHVYGSSVRNTRRTNTLSHTKVKEKSSGLSYK